MKRTPLFEEHKKLGAKMVPFAGWEMPLSYVGVLEEHRAVRNAVGLFDICHMGRVWVEGEEAFPFLQRVATNDVRRLTAGQAHYSLLLKEDGGILDDIFVYCMEGKRYLLCMNASNTEKNVAWLKRQAEGFRVSVSDRTAETGLIALQGPRAGVVLKRVASTDLSSMRLHSFVEGEVAGKTTLVARTGYTGEPGYEFFLEVLDVMVLWQALLEAGRGEGIQPIGLGARDTLRLEMGYCLYGHEIDEKTTPLEAGLQWVTPLEKGDFIGREALVQKQSNGIQKRLVGFELIQRGIPRQGCLLFSEGREVGVVTSGNHSPSLGKGIGMGYVSSSFAEIGGEILVDIRGRAIPAEIVERPFYRRKGKASKKEKEG